MERRRTGLDEHKCDTVKQRRLSQPNSHSNTAFLSYETATSSSIGQHVGNFIHEPLKDNKSQIRLLQMLPDGNDDEDSLRYSIKTQSFDQVLDFLAISYTWGAESIQRTILIGNKECSIRQNCHYALKHTYRHWKQGQLRSDLVWIDSVCINQDDFVEKGFQVSLMGEIYAQAGLVLACIGPHADDSEFLAQKARETAHLKYDCTQVDDDGFLCQDCRLPWEEWALSLGIKCLSRLCESCETFGRRVYWTRVWIIQEIAKATSLSVLCGTDLLPWTAFSNLDNFLAMEMDEMESMFKTYEELPVCEKTSMHEAFLAKRMTVRIEEIFERFAQSSCTDPRDHLYGLLSLIDWPNDIEPLFPDYNASVFDVAVRLAPHLWLEQIPEMLAAFQITSNNEVVRSLIIKRQGSIDFGDATIATNAGENFRPLTREDDDRSDKLPLCGWIELDQDEKITASLVTTNGTKHIGPDSPPGSMKSFDSLSEDSYDSEASARVAMASFISSTHPESRPQAIMFNSEVAGFVCKEACKGDVLVPLPNVTGQVLLVLRQSQGEIFDVIGQGVLMPEYELGWDPGVCDEFTKVALFKARIELRITAEDAVLLFAQHMDDTDHNIDDTDQDLDNTDQDVDDPSYSYNREDRWKQTLTNVTAMPSGAARVTKQTRMHAKDVMVSVKHIKGSVNDLPESHVSKLSHDCNSVVRRLRQTQEPKRTD